MYLGEKSDTFRAQLLEFMSKHPKEVFDFPTLYVEGTDKTPLSEAQAHAVLKRLADSRIIRRHHLSGSAHGYSLSSDMPIYDGRRSPRKAQKVQKRTVLNKPVKKEVKLGDTIKIVGMFIVGNDTIFQLEDGTKLKVVT
jgi:hypothetical protein